MKPTMPRKFLALVTVLILVVVLLGMKFYQESRLNAPAKTPSTTATAGIAALEEFLDFPRYQAVPAHQLSDVKGGQVSFHFTQGQANSINKLTPHSIKNFTLSFPKTWQAYTTTTDPADEIVGTNLILKKGSDFIVIRQRIFEGSTCVFDPQYARDMAEPCTFIKPLHFTGKNWNVFQVINDPPSAQDQRSWDTYGICDQDAYAAGISEYKVPDVIDKATCSSVTDIGEISFFTLSKSQQPVDEFVAIIQSLKVQ